MKKLFKIFNVLLFLTCSGLAAYAKPVDENTAKTIGCNFLISNYPHLVKTPADLSTAYVATAQANFGIVVDFYVFNVQGGTGFVMVSGDDNVIPVLACSNESSFNFDKIAPAAKYFIGCYQSQITELIENKVIAPKETAEMWANLMVAKPNLAGAAKTTGIFPSNTLYLLKTKWDQEPGYNIKCPAGTPTGCVATSMAQVMEYWNWPTVGCGYHTYKSKTLGQTLAADFSNTAYNWTSMNGSPTAYNAAIETLMYHCGVAVDMDYTTSSSGSGAYTTEQESPVVNCSEYALKTYFHYKRSTLRGVTRYNPAISDPTWIAMLKTELDNSRPVLYSGQGTSGGHAWVCDGYNASGQFHMNWGWSGNGPDGWYTVNNLNPPAVGTGGGGGAFNSYNSIIMGIQPDSFPNTTSTGIQLTAHLDCGTTAPVFNSPSTYVAPSFAIATQVGNTGSAAFTGDLALQIFDSAMNYVTTMETKTGQNIAAGGTSPALVFTNPNPVYQMIPGIYNARLMYRPTGTTTWAAVANNGTFINLNQLVVGNSQSIELNANITLTPASTTVKASQPLSVSSNIINLTSGTFSGSVRAVFTNVTTGTQTVIENKSGQSIFYNGNQSYSFYTPSVSVAPGTYTVAIQHAFGTSTSYIYTGSDQYQNPIIVTVVSTTGINTPSIADKISVFPNPASDVVNINTNGIAVSRVTVTDIRGRIQEEIAPDATQSVITLPVSNYAAGIYFVNLYAGEEVVTKKIVVAK